jgi:alpha-tubulin suppressor-like RCC1 family protein
LNFFFREAFFSLFPWIRFVSYKDVDSQHFSDLRPPDDDNQNDKGSGPGSVLGHRCEPVHVFQLPGRAKFIAAGGSINAAILEDDSLVTWGMGHSGQLARTQDVTDLRDSNNLIDLGHAYYMRMKNGQKTYLEDLVKDTFLTPKPVKWEIPGPKIVTHVSCGGEHILVAARTPGATSSRLYAAGGNAYGKLGVGDEYPRHELVLVSKNKSQPLKCVR